MTKNEAKSIIITDHWFCRKKAQYVPSMYNSVVQMKMKMICTNGKQAIDTFRNMQKNLIQFSTFYVFFFPFLVLSLHIYLFRKDLKKKKWRCTVEVYRNWWVFKSFLPFSFVFYLFLTIPKTQITWLFLCFLHKILGFLHIAINTSLFRPPVDRHQQQMMMDG